MSSLAAWNQEFGDEDYTKPDARPNRFTLQTDICYPVTIRTATLCTSSLGDVQIALDMDVRDYETDAVVAQVKDWISLPKQPRTDMSKEKKTVAMLTRIRRNMLAALLSAVDPPRFMTGKPVQSDGHKRHEDWNNGHVLDDHEFLDRQVECNRQVLLYADELHAMLDEGADNVALEGWPGTQLYHSKKENQRNIKYPYSHYFTEPAIGMPLFTQGATNDTPF